MGIQDRPEYLSNNMENRKLLSEVKESGGGLGEYALAKMILRLVRFLFRYKKKKYDRAVSFGDLFVDRREKAKFLSFGEGTTVYDNVLVLGDVKVAANTWIGPNVILDGSGGLEIGSHCVISAGVHIYSHDTVQWAVSGGKLPYEYARTVIKNNCYIGPNVIIQKGITIGEESIIGANSFVNKDIPPHSKAFGTPARVVPDVNTIS